VRLGYKMPGRTDEGHQMTGIFRFPSYPHAILVNRDGRRFCDESFYASIGHALKVIDGRAQRFANWPCWMIFDSQYREQYAIGSVTPTSPVPREWDWTTADSLAELARKIGVDAVGLQSQVDTFNKDAAEGRDTQFRRGERPWSRKSYGDPAAKGHPNLGPIIKPPFFAMRPDLVGTGIPTAGLDTDEVGRVLGGTGEPISGLYAAGNSSAVLETGAGYQSGVANTRSLTVAYERARRRGSRVRVTVGAARRGRPAGRNRGSFLGRAASRQYTSPALQQADTARSPATPTSNSASSSGLDRNGECPPGNS
jgi:3-oxosteroid 1-dehydrogenase